MEYPEDDELAEKGITFEEYINQVVQSDDPRAMLLIGGAIAIVLKDISISLMIQNKMMSRNYEDVVEKEVQQRGELRAAEIVEDSKKRNILGRRGPPPVKKTS